MFDITGKSIPSEHTASVDVRNASGRIVASYLVAAYCPEDCNLTPAVDALAVVMARHPGCTVYAYGVDFVPNLNNPNRLNIGQLARELSATL